MVPTGEVTRCRGVLTGDMATGLLGKLEGDRRDLWKCGDAGAGDSAPLSMDGSLLSAPLSYGSIGDSPPGEGRTRNLSPPPSVAGLAKSALTVVGDSAGG
eukprot:Tamp_07655.p5 GENE.Tamp_07655~~Tamp_07655.p5  ORF type:complete len:100 (+),score=11.73 Tamp_07655:2143-2442(+)